MIDLRKRSYQKELMDGDDIPFADIAQTLEELKVVNARLGGHFTTLKGVRSLARAKDSLVICEIGCGGGDNLIAIQKHFKGNNIRFIGIDMNPDCIAYAKEKNATLPCVWICSDYALVNMKDQPPDIIFSSLFCHHFTDEQLIFMLNWLRENSRLGFFINDLHRHWLAFYLIKYITKFFSHSYLVKNDASLSVARGFRRNEWERLFKKANVSLTSIEWRWAFRYLVVSKNVS
jgi:2-polyprenyl-3-methyl-5-hydroxy-6-metoxy-1,4-benzoquinol methylase